MHGVAAALQPLSVAGVVAEHVSHRLRSNGEEVSATAGGKVFLIGELEVGLVNDRGGIEREIAMPPVPLFSGDDAQLIVDERKQLVDRFALTSLKGLEEPGNCARPRLRHATLHEVKCAPGRRTLGFVLDKTRRKISVRFGVAPFRNFGVNGSEIPNKEESMMHMRAFLLPALLLATLAACSNDTVTDPPSPNTLAIEPVTLVSQSGRVGNAVPQAPTVRVTNGRGDPMGGIAVAFEITGGGNFAGSPTAHTGSDGRASVGYWNLGPKAGPQSITATVVGLAPVVFKADARAGPVASIIREGDEQLSLSGNPVPSPLAARFTDAFDNPVSGISVAFIVMSGGGKIEDANATTNADGVAKSGRWTLGPDVGQQHVVLSITPQPPEWFNVYFTAHACERIAGGKCEGGSPPVCSSPDDCGEIVFTTSRDGNAEIYSVNSDGTRLARLTNHPGVDESPAWSPDGRRIAFISDRSGTRDLYLMNADGSNVIRHPLRGSWIDRPSWSPDGTEIAISTISSEYASIIAVEADAVPARGRSLVVKTQAMPWGFEAEPSWSPDGKRVAMKYWADDESSFVATVNADGSGFSVITAGYRNLGFNNPSWSPDGTKLAVNFFSGLGVQIGIIDANNSLTPVTTADLFGKLSWSPDGRLLAFSSGKPGSRALSWVRVDGSESAVITTSGWDPDWRR